MTMHTLRPALASAVIAIVLVGCAADGTGGPDPSGAPSTNDAHQTTTPSGGDPPPPPFDASFDESDAGSTTTPPMQSSPPPSGGDRCVDTNDAGGSEALAQKLPDTDDCDGAGGTIKGVMNGAVDVDFYEFHVKDSFFCEANPHFQTSAEALEVCVFVKCDNSGTTTIKGCGSGAPKTSAIGDPGCCFATPGTMDFGYGCSGFIDPDSATFFVKVSQPAGDKCEPYSISYHD